MYKNDGILRRYSESFKLKILAELSTGKYSKRELGDIYGVNRTTINEWVKKYNRKDLDTIKCDMDFVKTFNLMSEIGDRRTMWTSIYNLSDGDYWVSYRRDYKSIFKNRIDIKNK